MELIIMFFYSSFVAILSAATSFIIEKDIDNAWSLNSKKRLFAVIYAVSMLCEDNIVLQHDIFNGNQCIAIQGVDYH